MTVLLPPVGFGYLRMILATVGILREKALTPTLMAQTVVLRRWCQCS